MKKENVAVLVGRFQTHILHPEQISLIQSIIDTHNKTIIILGNSIMRGTIKNPLDFKARKTLIQEKFPNLDVLYIIDDPFDDNRWSNTLDEIIKKTVGNPTAIVTIYGSTDTVVSKYTGKYNIQELNASSFVSPIEIRRLASQYAPTEQYRAGIIASTVHRFPTAYQTVDVAVVDENERILMARKPNEKVFCFIGGFSDPTSDSLEIDAKREVIEEASIEVDSVQYLGSTVIKREQRYFMEVDKIKTALFVAKYIFGRPEGKDDVAEVAWFPIKTLNKDNIAIYHHVLVDMFVEKFVNNPILYKEYTTK